MRKRVTQIFPFLIPVRRAQRKLLFYAKMKFDKRNYAKEIAEGCLKHKVYSVKNLMINHSTGQNIIYQQNKAHNIKLAGEHLNGLLILPGQTFSFWHTARNADKKIPYKSGLTVINGELKTEYGGGLCLLSSALYRLFLHSLLKIAERHSHISRAFPENEDDVIKGTDAAVYEGWKDLKIYNNTPDTYQLKVTADDEYLSCGLYCDEAPRFTYTITNGVVKYKIEGGDVFEYATVLRKTYDKADLIKEEMLYTDKVRIDYEIGELTGDADKTIAYTK